VRKQPRLCAALREKTRYLRRGLRGLGLEIIDSPASIVSFTEGDFAHMRALQQSLFDAGIYVMHSNYIAAGPAGTIRLAVFGDHSREDLDRLVAQIKHWRGTRPAA